MSNQLTRKQRQFLEIIICQPKKSATQAAYEVYSVKNRHVAEQIAYENMRKPEIRNALRPLLDRHNVNLDTAIKVIGNALSATKLNSNGIKYIDYAVRLQASDRALKLLNID